MLVDVLPFITITPTFFHCYINIEWVATYCGQVAGGLMAIYHNDTNHFHVQYINIVGAATYDGEGTGGCFAIYHNDINHFTVISILWRLLHMMVEQLVDVLPCITMTQTILLLY